MRYAFIAGLGGFIGTILRYLLNNWIYEVLDYPIFPFGVFLINILGCLAIGFLSGLAETRVAFTPEVKIFIFIGILGGFTTFSSFGYDSFSLLQDRAILYATFYVFGQLFLGLIAVWIGMVLARLI